MLSMVVRLLAVALFLCGTTVVRAAEVGPDGMTAAELKEFLTSLQSALRLGDATQVARHMYFPLRVNTENGVTHSYGGVAFDRHFEQIFTPALRQAVKALGDCLVQPISVVRQQPGALASGFAQGVQQQPLGIEPLQSQRLRCRQPGLERLDRGVGLRHVERERDVAHRRAIGLVGQRAQTRKLDADTMPDEPEFRNMLPERRHLAGIAALKRR